MLGNADYVLRWEDDNRHLLVGHFGLPYEIARVDPSTGKSSSVAKLMPRDPAGTLGISAVITPDGRHYAYALAQLLSTLFEVEKVE